MHDYFVRIQCRNSNFYHTLDLDYDLRMRNVFWVDAQSKATYESFPIKYEYVFRYEYGTAVLQFLKNSDTDTAGYFFYYILLYIYF